MTVEGLAAYRQLCLAAEMRGLQLELCVSEDFIRQSGVQCRALDRLVLHDPKTGTRKPARVGRSLSLAAGELLDHLAGPV